MASFLSSAQRKSLQHIGVRCGALPELMGTMIQCQRKQGHRGLHICELAKEGGRIAAKWPQAITKGGGA